MNLSIFFLRVNNGQLGLPWDFEGVQKIKLTGVQMSSKDCNNINNVKKAVEEFCHANET